MILGLVRRASTVLLLVLCVALLGTQTYLSLPREAAPDVEVPFVMVTTPYPGVAPSDIETLVTNPLERELAGLADLKKMSSTSAEGASMITLEFETEANIDEALQRVRDRVGTAKPKLPPEAEEPGIREISFSDVPVLIVTIAGPIDEEGLKKLGEALQDDVDRIPGVLNTTLTGGRERQIRVQLDPIRLEHYGLAPGDVIGAIQNENVNIPGGDLAVRDASFLLRVRGEFLNPSDVEQVAIKRTGDRPVFVRDVGRVIDGFKDRSSYARMNGQPAVSLAVTKRTGTNILNLAEAIKSKAAEHAQTWPEGVVYRGLGDQSKMIRDMVADLENGVLTALILVVTVLLFFMGLRNSLFVGAAIPLSFLLSMLAISMFDMTLNMMVLFSLILALGMLVDNAIVLVENIYRHLEEGASLKDAAVVGTSEVAGAVTASTATTVAAFLPLLFWKGIMGQFMGYMPKTVVIVLIASLVVAVGVLPVATARMMRLRRGAARPSSTDAPLARGGIMGMYQRVLEASIRHRYVAAGLGLASLVVTFAVYGAHNHGTEFLSETDPNRATVSVRAADGTDIEATDKLVRRVETLLASEENVDVYVAETGVAGGGSDPMAATQSSSNAARITVDFLPDAASAKPGEKSRVEPAADTVKRIRKALEKIPGAELTIEKEEMGPPVGAPIGVEVSGDDFHAVGDYAARLRRELAAIPGTAALSDDYRVGRPELRLQIDRGAAKRVGASTRAVAMAVRTAVAGTKASTLRDGEDEYDIIVELDPNARADLQSVLSLRIPGREDTSPDTFPVPLSTVASYELAGGNGAIKHIDQKLVVTIQGEIEEGHNENEVRAAVAKYIEEQASPPAGIVARLGGADDEQRAAQEFLSQAFLIAIFLIAIVLVWQFNRFDLPFIILASVVLSLVGVLWGLLLTGTPFGVIMTGLGVISLAGVVVNNAIVLLDYVEQLRAKGIALHESLIRAGTVRFRPVVLTALTTILGLVPMALGVSVDFSRWRIVAGSQSSQWWGPMAVAVIFGLAFATVLTLVMVPTLYSIVEDFRGLPARVRARFRGTAPRSAENRVEAESAAPAAS